MRVIQTKPKPVANHVHARQWPRPPACLVARDLMLPPENARITVAGLVILRQRPGTAKGVIFLTLEDETGIVNLVIYGSVFERYELVGRHAGIMLARGRVDRRGEVVHVRVSHLERLDMPLGSHAGPAELPIRSRDFH